MTDQTTTPQDDQHRRLFERPLTRAHALAETWADDPTPITRAEASTLLCDVLATTGWTGTEPPGPGLTLVATTEGAT